MIKRRGAYSHGSMCPSGRVVEAIRNSCALTWKHFLQLLPFPSSLKKAALFYYIKEMPLKLVEMCRRNGLDPEIRRCNAEHVSFRTLALVVHTFRRGVPKQNQIRPHSSELLICP